jgi:flagellar protein FlaG
MEIGQVYANPALIPGEKTVQLPMPGGEPASTPVAQKKGNATPLAKRNQEAVMVSLQKKQAAADPPDLGERIKEMTERFNAYLKESKLDLHFYLHEGVKRMALQVIQDSTGKVLREYPPREWLDLEAKLRDMVGVFVDVDNA